MAKSSSVLIPASSEEKRLGVTVSAEVYRWWMDHVHDIKRRESLREFSLASLLSRIADCGSYDFGLEEIAKYKKQAIEDGGVRRKRRAS
jgi:hypothetical protein